VRNEKKVSEIIHAASGFCRTPHINVFLVFTHFQRKFLVLSEKSSLEVTQNNEFADKNDQRNHKTSRSDISGSF
jgi:hypothetical protein